MLGWIQLGNKRINLDVVREIEDAGNGSIVLRWKPGDQITVAGIAASRILAKLKAPDLEREKVARAPVKLAELQKAGKTHRPGQ